MQHKEFLFSRPVIYLITDGSLTPQNFSRKLPAVIDFISLAAENGIPLIQIREKRLLARLLYELVTAAVKAVRKSRTKILVNDRADIALAAGADGVHLASDSPPVSAIRQNFPASFIIGFSAHSAADIEKIKQAADFAVFSPIFSSPGKGAPVGLNVLRNVCDKFKDFPILALGGIDQTNYESVLEAGATGFAAIRFLNDGESLRKLTDKLRNER